MRDEREDPSTLLREGAPRPQAHGSHVYSAGIDTKRDIIAIGGSAGALRLICEILAGLPRDLPVTVLVVMHRPVSAPSSLPQILLRNTGWDVVVAGDREPLWRAACMSGCQTNT
jgi:chemotaxis response regulator CheB